MQINVAPDENGRWNWERVEDDDTAKVGPGFDVRGEAIAAARTEGGAEEVTVIRGGLTETYSTAPKCRIVLLRADGAEVGELDAAPGDGAVGQTITLTPATEDTKAVDLGEGDRG